MIQNCSNAEITCLFLTTGKRDLFGNVVNLKKKKKKKRKKTAFSQDVCYISTHKRNLQANYKLLKIEVHNDNRQCFITVTSTEPL